MFSESLIIKSVINQNTIHKTLTFVIATVWIINGLYCKILNYVPRHEEIVASILNLDSLSARYMTCIIGVSELIMAIWILSGYKSKVNVVAQIIVVGSMNVLEFLLVPEVLLWGQMNFVFALLFMALVYMNEFVFIKINTHVQIS